MGFTHFTYVTFTYSDPTNGEYELFWSRRGHHDLGFMNLGGQSKVVWAQPVGTNKEGQPRLRIVAFEGLEPDWGVLAKPGHRTNELEGVEPRPGSVPEF
jgi:hypothetical protein